MRRQNRTYTSASVKSALSVSRASCIPAEFTSASASLRDFVPVQSHFSCNYCKKGFSTYTEASSYSAASASHAVMSRMKAQCRGNATTSHAARDQMRAVFQLEHVLCER